MPNFFNRFGIWGSVYIWRVLGVSDKHASFCRAFLLPELSLSFPPSGFHSPHLCKKQVPCTSHLTPPHLSHRWRVRERYAISEDWAPSHQSYSCSMKKVRPMVIQTPFGASMLEGNFGPYWLKRKERGKVGLQKWER